ncbi:hypothetical protein IWQ60_003240 [Tieghemiomyces parasiticus]|uniref:CENP-T/Histone H4 histone fold domain-containing protein n=1 Tax=Tieghemiomyces parasiticus TaxID=78921 RepID=A0A9W8E0W1_9FUNG|nr:hypothetical protein IWQ60_003240 [Tieghemiomyces parasiticus]
MNPSFSARRPPATRPMLRRSISATDESVAVDASAHGTVTKPRAADDSPHTLLRALTQTYGADQPSPTPHAIATTPIGATVTTPLHNGQYLQTPRGGSKIPDANLRTLMRSASRPVAFRTPARTPGRGGALRNRLAAVAATSGKPTAGRAQVVPTPGASLGRRPPNAEESPMALLRLLAQAPANRPLTPKKLPQVAPSPALMQSSAFSYGGSLPFGEGNDDAEEIPTAAVGYDDRRNSIRSDLLSPVAVEVRRRAIGPAGDPEYEVEYPHLAASAEQSFSDDFSTFDRTFLPGTRAPKATVAREATPKSAFLPYSLGPMDDISFEAESFAPSASRHVTPKLVPTPHHASHTPQPTVPAPYDATAPTPMHDVILPTGSPGIIMAAPASPSLDEMTPARLSHTDTLLSSTDRSADLDLQQAHPNASGLMSFDRAVEFNLDASPAGFNDFELVMDLDGTTSRRGTMNHARLSMHSVNFTPGPILLERDFSLADYGPGFSMGDVSQLHFPEPEVETNPLVAPTTSITSLPPISPVQDVFAVPEDREYEDELNSSASTLASAKDDLQTPAKLPPAKFVGQWDPLTPYRAPIQPPTSCVKPPVMPLYPRSKRLPGLKTRGSRPAGPGKIPQARVAKGLPAIKRVSRHGIPLPNFPVNWLRDTFRAVSKQKNASRDTLACLEGISQKFFEQIAGQLAAQTTGRSVHVENVAELFINQRLITPQTNLNALAMHHLPRELVNEVFESAKANAGHVSYD